MNVTPTSRGPALTEMRNSSDLSGSGSPVLGCGWGGAESVGPRRLGRPASSRRVCADRDDLRALAVHADLELVRLSGGRRQLDSDQVVAVGGEGAS